MCGTPHVSQRISVPFCGVYFGGSWPAASRGEERSEDTTSKAVRRRLTAGLLDELFSFKRNVTFERSSNPDSILQSFNSSIRHRLPEGDPESIAIAQDE